MVIGVLKVLVPHTHTRVHMNVPVLVQLILKKFNLERSTFYALLPEVPSTRFYQRCTFYSHFERPTMERSIVGLSK